MIKFKRYSSKEIEFMYDIMMDWETGEKRKEGRVGRKQFYDGLGEWGENSSMMDCIELN